MNDLSIIAKYAPIHYFDQQEPFLPVKVGVTELREAGPSLSFRCHLSFADERLDFIIEYAIYWDFDIQHLYELEHVGSMSPRTEKYWTRERVSLADI